jgi:hypothetical protein
MRRGSLSLFTFLVGLVLMVSGCTVGRQTNPGGTPEPPPKLPTEVIAAATNFGGGLLGQINALGGLSDRLTELLKTPRLGEPDWELMVNANGAAIEMAYEGISAMNPPEQLKPMHSAAVDAAGDCLAARKTVQTAMEAGDTSKLSEAIQQADRCVTKAGNLRTELQQLAKDNSFELIEIPITGSMTGSATEVNTVVSPGAEQTGIVNETANLRSGPGTTYGKVGGLNKGAAVTVIGRNEAGDWLVVQAPGIPQAWIAAFLVNGVTGVQNLPVVRPPP